MIVPLDLRTLNYNSYFCENPDRLFVYLDGSKIFVGNCILVIDGKATIENKNSKRKKTFKINDPRLLREDEFRYICDWASFRSNSYWELVTWSLNGGTDSILIYTYLKNTAITMDISEECLYGLFADLYAGMIIEELK